MKQCPLDALRIVLSPQSQLMLLAPHSIWTQSVSEMHDSICHKVCATSSRLSWDLLEKLMERHRLMLKVLFSISGEEE